MVATGQQEANVATVCILLSFMDGIGTAQVLGVASKTSVTFERFLVLPEETTVCNKFASLNRDI